MTPEHDSPAPPPAASSRLSGLRPRAGVAASSGGGYTAFVKMAKLLLPVAALAIVGIVAVRLSSAPQRNTLPEKAEQPEQKAEAGKIAIENATYNGIDAAGRPYEISATSAERDPVVETGVILHAPAAKLSLDGDSDLSVAAAGGTFDTASKQLALSGGVTLSYSAKYSLSMDGLTVDIPARQAQSAGAVSGSGDGFSLSASSLTVEDGGTLIRLDGPARLSFDKI